MDALLESELNDAIKNILNATEQDPIFEEILDDVVQSEIIENLYFIDYYYCFIF